MISDSPVSGAFGCFQARLVIPEGVSVESVRVALHLDFDRKLGGALENHMERLWQERLQKIPSLFNGLKFRLAGCNSTDEKGDRCVHLQLGSTDYREFQCTNMSVFRKNLVEYGREHFGDSDACLSNAVGVGAVLVTTDMHVVLMRRSQAVGESAGMVDVPGGKCAH